MSGEADTDEVADRGPTPRVPMFSARARKWGLAGFLIAGALMLFRFMTVDVPPLGEFKPSDRAFVTLYDPPSTATEIMIDVGDGQAWAALGQDPTLSHPEVFYDGKVEFVYRAQRPMFGWMIWATTFGQPGLAPFMTMFLTAVGVGLMTAMAFVLAERDGRATRLVPLVLCLPGTILMIVSFGPEPLAFAIAMLGVLWWTGPPRRRALAVAAFTVAVLSRDLLIVVPAVLGLWQLVQRRDRIRDLVVLAVPFVAYAGWTVSLRARYGTWPSQVNQLRRALAPPMKGLVAGLPEYGLLVWVSLLLMFGLLIVAVVRRRDSLLTWLAASFMLPALVFGEDVWVSEFYRVLLPVYVLTIIVLLPRDRRARAAPELRSKASLEAAPRRG